MNDRQHHFGYQSVSQQQREQNIRQVFKRVAKRYDLMNDLMSFASHRIWKRSFVQMIPVKSTDIIVDLAGGTGDIARRLLAKGARVIVVDASLEMMQASPDKPSAQLTQLAAIGEQLPFADNSIDTLSISFGIRNMTRLDQALTEIYRVLKPGGQFYCLEFSQVMQPIRPFYSVYNRYVIPCLGAWVSGQPLAYQYLIESIQQFPNQQKMCALIEQAGFVKVGFRNLFFGIACIHYAQKL